MALNIISNYSANVAHRNLVSNDAGATASISKLSAGTRVVSAKDDAASLAIGSRLRAETESLRQASTNATQAGSLLQIADGAMSTVSDILVRLKTLAVQSSSGQLANAERATLDAEFQALLAEIDRIAQDTEFNGVSLINGSTSVSTIRNATAAGASKIETADGFQAITFSRAGAYVFSYDATNDVMTATNQLTNETEGVAIGSTAITGNNTQTVNFNNLGVVVTLNAAFSKAADITVAADSTNITAGGGTVTDIMIKSLSPGTDVTLAQLETAINAVATGVLTLAGASQSAITLTAGAFTGTFDGTGANSTVSVNLADTAGNTITVQLSIGTAFSAAATGDITAGEFANLAYAPSLSSGTTSFTFKLGTGVTANVDTVTFSLNASSVAALGLTGQSVTTASNADSASTAVSAAINTLNNARAVVGAAQNRLSYATSNLSTAIENSEAARSQLLDLDIASEITRFTSKQILVQAGVSVLAQANQMPQNLLKLLG